jgi:hypothetical protein
MLVPIYCLAARVPIGTSWLVSLVVVFFDTPTADAAFSANRFPSRMYRFNTPVKPRSECKLLLEPSDQSRQLLMLRRNKPYIDVATRTGGLSSSTMPVSPSMFCASIRLDTSEVSLTRRPRTL